MGRLEELRDEIDRVNRQILDLLERRGEIVLEIADAKQSSGIDGYDPRREEEMLHELTSDLRGPFAQGAIRDVFKTIFRISLELQKIEWSSACTQTRTKPSFGPLQSPPGPPRPCFQYQSTHSSGKACSSTSYFREIGRICSAAIWR